MQRRGERVRKECEMRSGGGTPNLATRPGLGGLGSYPKGTSGCIWYGLGLKMAWLGFFVGGAAKSGGWGRLGGGGRSGLRRAACGDVPLRGIAQGGGRVRNTVVPSDGKEVGYFRQAEVTVKGFFSFAVEKAGGKR